jgi:MFS family permease
VSGRTNQRRARGWPRFTSSPPGTLIAAVLAGAVGQGVFIACGVVFAVRWVGIAPHEIGVGMTLSAVFSLVVPVPAGRLVETVGARIAAIVFSAVAAMALGGYAFVSSPLSFCLVQLLVSGSIVGLAIAQNTLVADLLAGGDRVRFKARQRSVRNIGLSVGALFAAVPLQLDQRWAYQVTLLVGAVCAAGAVWLTARLPRDPDRSSRPRPAWAVGLRDIRFAVLSVLCGITAMRYAVLTVALPLWITTHTRAPAGLAAASVVLNTAIVILLQVRASRKAATAGGAVRVNLVGSAALGLSCLMFASAAVDSPVVASVLLLAGVVVFTLGEMWTSAAAWTFSFELTRDERHATYQAAFSLGSSLGSTPGPLLAALLVGAGQAGWGAGVVVFVLTGLATAAVVGGRS